MAVPHAAAVQVATIASFARFARIHYNNISVIFMKVRPSVRKICINCRLIRRKKESYGDMLKSETQTKTRVICLEPSSVRISPDRLSPTLVACILV